MGPLTLALAYVQGRSIGNAYSNNCEDNGHLKYWSIFLRSAPSMAMAYWEGYEILKQIPSVRGSQWLDPKIYTSLAGLELIIHGVKANRFSAYNNRHHPILKYAPEVLLIAQIALLAWDIKNKHYVKPVTIFTVALLTYSEGKNGDLTGLLTLISVVAGGIILWQGSNTDRAKTVYKLFRSCIID